MWDKVKILDQHSIEYRIDSDRLMVKSVWNTGYKWIECPADIMAWLGY